MLTQYTYEPFGNTTSSGTPSSSSYQYTGRENDGTGLYFYRARYYKPTFQRFVSEDPAGFDGRINLYAYAANNPLYWIDPFGLNVTLTLYPGEGINGFGHIGISVNGQPAVGFTDASDLWNLPALAIPVPGAVKPIDPSRPVADSITIPTLPDQDKRIQRYIDDRTKNPGIYDLVGRNCAQFARDALGAGGIPVPPLTEPETLMHDLRKRYPRAPR